MNNVYPTGRVRAFTLIELMVVIAIVSVMVSMLLPALSASREVAKEVRCTANLRQTFHGFSEYANGNKTYWVMSGYNYNILWSRIVMYTLGLKYIGEQNVAIGAYAWNDGAGDQGYGDPSLYKQDYYSKARGNGIMKCPSENFLNFWGGQNATSYRMNSGYSYGYGLGLNDSYTINPSYRLVWGRMKEQQFEKPSRTFIIGDGIVAGGDYEYNINNLGSTANIATYHNGGANFLYNDGHAGFVLKIAATSEMFDRRR